MNEKIFNYENNQKILCLFEFFIANTFLLKSVIHYQIGVNQNNFLKSFFKNNNIVMF
jgi:hypothetical protein